MRTLGLPELLVIIGLFVLLLGGARIPRLFGWLGERLKTTVNQVKWVYQSMGGTEEQEVRAEETVGAELAEGFLQQMPPDPDESVQERVGRVGGRLADAKEAGKRRFVFQVVQGSLANAYALPGGYVFVTRRLADLCGGDADETAFLLAHEMGHLVCRHMVERKMIESLLRVVRTGQLAGELFGKGFSREQEREADLKALDLASDAGFDPNGALRLLAKLAEHSPPPPEFASYFSTHPSTDQRLDYVNAHLQRQPS